MNSQNLWIFIGIGLATLVVIPLLIKRLAESNIIWTTVREGTAKAVVAGESFKKILLSRGGYMVNDNWDIVPVSEPQKQSMLVQFAGIYFIGFIWPFKEIYNYKFKWTEEDTDKEGVSLPRHREEITDFIYIADFPYLVEIEGAEIAGNIPINARYLLTLAITNPKKALFDVDDWLSRTIGAANREGRNYLGVRSFEQLTSEIEADKAKGRPADLKPEDYFLFSSPIIALTEKLPDDKPGGPQGLKGHYGVEVRSAELQSIRLVNDPDGKAAAATIQKYIAEREAEARRAEAEGIRDSTITIANGDRERIRLVYDEIEKRGATGLLIRQLEAIEKTGNSDGKTVIWANNPLIKNSGLADILEAAGITNATQLAEVLRGGQS